uniref:Uncharacterized protein n=1 Tax=Leptocylindrus danicus TaxID=163516 RepID=A0A7S2JWK8_9STRA|mmetsp:Transcript_13154/g.19668  ORF Transcript_13154/g.19668 Transcript_13154/m.19668 type:complete len:102 (+) Transcript_13154:175-480(+)
MQGKDIVIQPKDNPTVIAEYEKDFYPCGKPNKKVDLDGHAIYLATVQKALDRARDEHANWKLHYKSNNNKLRNIAIGQCDKGIQSLIQQQPEYDVKKLDLF